MSPKFSPHNGRATPKLTLLDLPDIVLIAILHHLPLNVLLLLSLVCSRLHYIKRLVCAQKRNITVTYAWEAFTRGYDLDLAHFFNIDLRPSPNCLLVPCPTNLMSRLSRKVTFFQLEKLACIFPNIQQLVVFRLDYRPTVKSFTEDYVRKLAELLTLWKCTLKSLTLCMNREFSDQTLIACIGTQLTSLESLQIELSSHYNSGHNGRHIALLLPFVLSRVKQLHLGPIYSKSTLQLLYGLFKKQGEQCTVRSWSMSFNGSSFLAADQPQSENSAFNRSLSRLRFIFSDKEFHLLEPVSFIYQHLNVIFTNFNSPDCNPLHCH